MPANLDIKRKIIGLQGGDIYMVEIFASKTAEIEEREVLHADISRKLAGECMVLLENDGALPIHTKKWHFSEMGHVRRSKAVLDREM